VLARIGSSRLGSPGPVALPQRYERERPGELLHLGTKKLGRIEAAGHRIHGDRGRRARGAGWEYAYVAIADHSRLGFAQLHAAENGLNATVFLNQALAYYDTLGIRWTQSPPITSSTCGSDLPASGQGVDLISRHRRPLPQPARTSMSRPSIFLAFDGAGTVISRRRLPWRVRPR